MDNYINLVYPTIIALVIAALTFFRLETKDLKVKIPIMIVLVVFCFESPQIISNVYKWIQDGAISKQAINAAVKAKEAKAEAEAEASEADLKVATAKREVAKAEQAKDQAYAASVTAYGSFIIRTSENKLELFEYGEEQGYDIRKIDSEYYVGDYVNGERTGYGIVKYSNGRIVSGQWMRNRIHGYAVETLQNSNVEFYSGQWVNGNKTGYGVYSNAKGQIFSGQIVNSNTSPILNGYGKLDNRIDDNDPGVFWGQFSNGEISGYRMDEYEKSKYLGKYSGGRFHGTYTVTHGNEAAYKELYELVNYRSISRTDLVYYAGEWSGWKYEGYGVICFANGDYYAGQLKNSKPYGYGIMYDKKNIVVLSGVWIEGKYDRQ